MLRSRGRVFYTIARLEKVWSCVDPMECILRRANVKADLYLLRGGVRPNPPNPPWVRPCSVMSYALSASVITAGGDVCGDVVLALLSLGFKFLFLLFNHTMRMMMTIVTTSSTASNDTTTPATILADDPLVILSPDFLSVVEKHFTSA